MPRLRTINASASMQMERGFSRVANSERQEPVVSQQAEVRKCRL